MTTFTWTISAVNRAISLDGLSNVIQTVHWRYRGTDENGTTAETYGALAMPNPNPEDFTPWDQVTTAVVEGWLETIFSEEVEGQDQTQLEKMQANIQQKIDLINNPTTITGPLADQEQ
jgi:hypothetical protein